MKRLICLLLSLLLSLGATAPLVLAYSVSSDTIVYVAPNGEKYHREGCTHLKGSAAAMTIWEAAEVKGLGACSRCHPDVLTGPYVSSGKSSGSSGQSGGSTTPNFPDKYEPPSETESAFNPAADSEPTPSLVRNNSSKDWAELILTIIFYGPLILFWLYPIFRWFFAGIKNFFTKLFPPKSVYLTVKMPSEKEMSRLEYENSKKVARLESLLSKGYCTNPYTKQPMLNIDDFIAYVERLNRTRESQQHGQARISDGRHT